MNKIKIWKGSHSEEVYSLIKETYEAKEQTLILCPPRIKNIMSYLQFLPAGEVSFYGDFSEDTFVNTSENNFSQYPKFGLFSTGTTSASEKLILYTNKNFDHSIDGILTFFCEDSFECVYSYPQPYHVFGLSLGYILSIKSKLDLIYSVGHYSRDSHILWVDSVKSCVGKILTLGTPTHFRDLMKSLDVVPPRSYANIIGGASVSTELWHETRNKLNILNPSIGYGCSEASPGITHLEAGVAPLNDGSLGKLIPNIKLELHNSSIKVFGDNVCLGYIQENKYIEMNGELIVNDMLEIDEELSYHFRGRSDLIVNRGGENFSIEEIELFLKSKLEAEVVVTFIKDERLGYDLVFLLESECKGTEEKLLTSLSDKYQRSFRKENILYVESFPMNANSKLDRKKCANLVKDIHV